MSVTREGLSEIEARADAGRPDDVRALAVALREALDVLELLEWNDRDAHMGDCALCEGTTRGETPGHTEGCRLAKSLGRRTKPAPQQPSWMARQPVVYE